MLSRDPRSIALTLLPLAAIAAGPPSSVAKAEDANPTPAPGRMFVVGRVLDTRGNPVPGAAVMVHARDLRPGRAPFLSRVKSIPLAGGRADASGRFRIDAPRTSSARYDDFGAVAIAPGHGVGWVALDADDDQPEVEISLRPEQVIHGRLFDMQGRPAPGVRVSVASIGSDRPAARARLHDRSVHGRWDGVAFWSRDTQDDPAWPRPVTTDAEGRFTVRGVGRGLQAALIVRDPRFAMQSIQVETDDAGEPKTVTAALAPTQVLNVRVTYADTGQPVPHAPLRISAIQQRSSRNDEVETDDNGQARIHSWPTERGYAVRAYPPEGQPYLQGAGRADWPKGALEQSLTIALPRGVLVQGKVSEEGSGKPVAGAWVHFMTGRRAPGEGSSIDVYTDSSGSFRVGAEPRPGDLRVRGPDDTYVFQAFASRLALEGRPGGGTFYAHAGAALDLKPGLGAQEVNLVLRRGATVEGRVVGPDGRPVRRAWIYSRFIDDPSLWASLSWTALYHGKVSNGRFEIHGLAPDAEVPVSFLEPERKLGAVVNLSAESASRGPVTVRLEPCGAARAWLVDPDGKPVTKPVRNLSIRMVVTPGRADRTASNEKAARIPSAADGRLADVDPINYETDPAPDPGGRVTLPVLIPGATYRIIDYTMVVRGGQNGPELRKEFTVKPGQKLDLGDIRIARPSS